MLPEQCDARLVAALYANFCSYVLDYAARQKFGGTSLSYFHLKQFPVLTPAVYDRSMEWSKSQKAIDWIFPRVFELTYTAWDMQPFSTDCGHDGPPFRWDERRRFLLRCELDAAFFHLYGLDRDDVVYILDTFPVVRKRDEAKHGEYRTQRVILEVYDRIADAANTGVPYQTLLDPPPADPRVAHPARHAAPPTRRQVHRGQVSLYILLLLHAWNKPVTRQVLDAALVLMFNDDARRTLLGEGLGGGSTRRPARPLVSLPGLDGLLDHLCAVGHIIIDVAKGHQIFQLGPQAPSTDEAGEPDRKRVAESIRAISVVGDVRVRLELEQENPTHEAFEFVP